MAHRNRIAALALGITMVLASAGSALAGPPAAGDSPPPDEVTVPVFTGPSEVSGTVCEPIAPAFVADVTGGALGALPTCPDKTRPVAYVYKVESITGHYDGYYLISDMVGCEGPCELGVDETQNWSHAWGVSISLFPKSAINGAISYATASPSADASSALALSCAVQWRAFGADYESERPIGLSLAFIATTVLNASFDRPVSVAVVTDHGTFAASIEKLIVSAPHSATTLYTIFVRLPALPPDEYRLTAVELTDGDGPHRFAIGDWIVQVLAGSAPSDLDLQRSTAGGDVAEGPVLQPIEIQLASRAASDIEITGAEANIPGLQVRWRLYRPSDAGNALPTPGPAVASIALPPGKQADLGLWPEATGSEAGDFVWVKPLLAYRVAGETRLLSLPGQVFARSLEEDAAIAAYLRTLPAEACGAGATYSK